MGVSCCVGWLEGQLGKACLLEVDCLGGGVVVVLEVGWGGGFEGCELEVEIAADAHIHFVSDWAAGLLVVAHDAVVEEADLVCQWKSAGSDRGLCGMGPKGRADYVGVDGGVAHSVV